MPAPENHRLSSGISRFQAGAGVVLRGLEHRAELAGLELVDLRSHVATAGALIAIATAAFYLAGLALTLFVAAIFWDTPHRVAALAWLSGVEVFLGLSALFWMRRRWRNWRPFSATREQLHCDAQCLHQIFSPQN